MRLNPARLATLLHTLVPSANISAELDMIVAIWNSESDASRPNDGSVVNMTLCPTDVASNAQKSTLKIMELEAVDCKKGTP